MNCLLSMNKSTRRCVFCTVSKTGQIGLRALAWKRTSNSHNISSVLYVQLRLLNVWEHRYKLSWKYVNTAEIISKVTITHSLINSNKDFDFVGWVIKTPCLLYFRSAKFHYVKETHDIYSLLTLVKIVLVSQHNRQPNKSFSRFVGNWKHPDSDLKVYALHYANELLVRIRLAFQKLLKIRQKSRNKKKLSKYGFWLWWNIV